MKLIAQRKTDELGRIVLPTEVRAKLGAETGATLNIYEDGNNIVIGNSLPYCKLCGSSENINSEVYLCADCIEKIKNI